MFTIAGGILLAVLMLALLPWLLASAVWVVVILVVGTIGVAAVWAVYAGAQSFTGFALS
ncbi:hypothetical protein [Bradyrhizobium sp. 27S5]|uniref:hypothetical protein n=1 Tax=Bradyrhizobium sp. 27S5 TaxID=3139728 RepID=UPI0030D081B0